MTATTIITIIIALEIASAVLLPYVLEWLRLPMGDAARRDAPGQFITLPQGITHYRYFGSTDKSAPLLVCVHGLTTPCFVFEALAARLTDGGAKPMRILTYDLYGRGFSARPEGKQDAAFFIAQLQSLLDALGEKDKFSLCGYSMGGGIVAAYAAALPGRVAGLYLIAPVGMGHHLPAGFPRLAAMRPMRPVARLLFMLTYPYAFAKGIEAERGLAKEIAFISDRQLREIQYRGFLPAVFSSLTGMILFDAQTCHAKIKDAGIPTTAIWGERDDVIPLAGRDVLHKWNPDCRHHVITGGDHAITYTHSGEVAKIIADDMRQR